MIVLNSLKSLKSIAVSTSYALEIDFTPSLMNFSQAGQNLINGGSFGPESSLIATVVFVIVLILVIYYPKK